MSNRMMIPQMKMCVIVSKRKPTMRRCSEWLVDAIDKLKNTSADANSLKSPNHITKINDLSHAYKNAFKEKAMLIHCIVKSVPYPLIDVL